MPTTVKKKPQLPPIRCKGCGLGFHPKDHRQHFHSPRCRTNYYNRTYFKVEEVQKLCLECQSPFKTTSPKKQLYCSAECRIAHQSKQSQNQPVHTFTLPWLEFVKVTLEVDSEV